MLDKKYNHLIVEEEKYNFWLKNNYFTAGNLEKKPFSIVIPPPNVTGKLHLGHAWDTTIQDVIIRYKRMDGYDTLWLPGMDHAAISTEAKVVSKLKSDGIEKQDLGRIAFIEECWKWTDDHKDKIRKQWGKLGLSLDYTKERFTLDKGCSEAVKYVFVKLYEKGLIYRGERIINWDPDAKTAISNEEVIYKEVSSNLYYIKYFIDDINYLTVATTRPETLFGDTALAVNPNDKRYKDLVGKEVLLPIVNKKIPIIKDNYVDMNYATGVVKITPAHDNNDFEVGNRHNLDRIVIMNKDGTMNENTYQYEGLDRFICREKIINELKEKDLLIKIEPLIHSVPHSERTNAMIEPFLSKQWFVKMRPLANQVIKTQKTKDKVNFVPKQFEKTMLHWMEITYDWCISRQQWWGHQLPVWYKNDQIYVGINEPNEEGWIQETDVLDTWFSSALWPFSTLGWPHNLNTRYFPNNVLVTGYDIIFFWVCRMIFQSLAFTKEIPFKECLIHGLIRDNKGQKMSKSLGNGVDPMDIIDTYGADSLRYFLATSSALGMDLRYDDEKVKSSWNFINKIWNASRFVLISLEIFNINDYSLTNLSNKDKWFLDKLNKTIKDVRYYMEKYEFHTVGAILYNFIWDDYCSSYIELSKIQMNNTTKSCLYYGLLSIIKMLHPFMPYVTEEIYQRLPFKDKNSIMIEEYPIYKEEYHFSDAYQKIEDILIFINMVRNKKQENNILNDSLCVIDIDDIDEYLIIKILKLNPSKLSFDEIDGVDIQYETKDERLFRIKYETKKEINKEKAIEALKRSISKREKLLNNENYIDKAPKHIVDLDREKLKEELKELALLENNIKKN